MDRRTFMSAACAGVLLPRAGSCAEAVRLREIYEAGEIAGETRAMEGQRIAVWGYMAPPLKADAGFFVLTNAPMSVCPFCEVETEWPDNILAVYTKRRVRVTPFNVKITVRGVLELGAVTDPDTGFVSLVRRADATYG